jgi:hypothetical protein
MCSGVESTFVPLLMHMNCEEMSEESVVFAGEQGVFCVGTGIEADVVLGPLKAPHRGLHTYTHTDPSHWLVSISFTLSSSSLLPPCTLAAQARCHAFRSSIRAGRPH